MRRIVLAVGLFIVPLTTVSAPRVAASTQGSVGPLVASPTRQQNSLAVVQLSDHSTVAIGATTSSNNLSYARSTDAGRTWTSPVTVASSGASSTGPFDADAAGMKVVIAFFADTTSISGLSVATLDFSVSPPQRSVDALTTTGHFGPPSIAISQTVTPGQALAVGYARSNRAADGYRVQFHQQGLTPWSVESLCDPGMLYGSVVAERDDTLHCIGVSDPIGTQLDNLVDHRLVASNTWGTGQRILPQAGQMHVVDDNFDFIGDPSPAPNNGLVGVVGGDDPLFAQYNKGTQTWTVKGTLGYSTLDNPRLGAIVASNGVAFTAVGSYDTFDGFIQVPFTSLDGGSTWREGGEVAADPLTTVLFQPTSWNLRVQEHSQLVYDFLGGSSPLGATIGGSAINHPITSATGKVAATFTASATGSVTEARMLFASTATTPKYRIGLRALAPDGTPAASWLVEQRDANGALISGSYADTTPYPGDNYVWFGAAPSLAAGTAYALVVEPAPISGPNDVQVSSTQYASVVGAATSPGSTQATSLRTYNGATWSTAATDEVPVFRLEDSAHAVVATQPWRSTGSLDINAYASGGTKITPTATTTPTTLRLSVSQKPTTSDTVDLHVLDSSGAETWSATTPNLSPGWNDVPVSGLTLLGGQTYSLVLTSSDTSVYYSTSNTWRFATSDTPDSSLFTLATSYLHPGEGNRAIEAFNARDRDHLNPSRLGMFAVAGDAVVIADRTKFRYLDLRTTGGTGSSNVRVEYWTSSGWHQDPGFPSGATLNGWGSNVLDVGSPSDWATQPFDGRDQFAIRLTALTTPTSRVDLELLRRYSAPSAVSIAPLAKGDAALVWADHDYNETASTMRFTSLPAVGAWLTQPGNPINAVLAGDADVRPMDRTGVDHSALVSYSNGQLSSVGTNVPSTFSVDPSAGVTATFEGLPVNVVPTATFGSGAVSVINNSTVLYADMLPSSDYAVRPTGDGFATYQVLHSASAPTTMSYRVSSPGHTVTLSPSDLSIGVVVDGQTVAYVDQVWAVDATGASVPTSVTTATGTLTVTVDVSSPTIKFPVIVDPDWGRSSRNYTQDSGSFGNVKVRVRGFNMSKCINTGNPCLSWAGNFRPEATAQSHALRRLAKLYGGGSVPDTLDWEVSPRNASADESTDDEPDCGDNGYRVDISLDMSGIFDLGGHYRLIEVKHASGLTAARTQVNCYVSRMQNELHLNTDLLAALYDDHWAVKYRAPDTSTYMAWAPETGIVLFANLDSEPERIPQWVKDSAHWTGNESIGLQSSGPYPVPGAAGGGGGGGGGGTMGEIETLVSEIFAV